MNYQRITRQTLIAACTVLAGCATTQTPRPSDREADRIAREAIANERNIRVQALPARSVTVAPFTLAVTDTSLDPLRYALADLLLTDLAQSSQLTVVERMRMDAIMREMRLASTGVVDPATAPRVGRLVGARRIVLGTITQRPRTEDLIINLRIADVSTSRVSPIPAAGARTADIIEAEKVLAFRVFENLGVTLTPAERAAINQRPTRNIGALLAYGRGVRYEVWGDYAAAAREYAEALRRDPAFRRAGDRRREAERLAPRTRVASSPVARAAAATNERISGVFVTPIGGAARPGSPVDPAFIASTVTIFVTITTPP